MQELEIEEIQPRERKEEILKIFVYNTKGEKIKEELYSTFVETYEYVLEHNAEYPDDPYNIYPGTTFPPKGYKWSETVNDWVEINLFEKWRRGEVDIPVDCKIVHNFVVRKNLTDLYMEGKLKIPIGKKLDSELDMIVDKTEQELIDEGILSWEDVQQKLYSQLKDKLDHYLDSYYFKYPKNILSHFKLKAEIARRWLTFTEEEKTKERNFDFINFLMLISEFKDSNVYLTKEEVESKLTELCKKIVNKSEELESKVGHMNNFFNQLYNEFENIKKKKNYLLLTDFVHQIDQRILQWIKS